MATCHASDHVATIHPGIVASGLTSEQVQISASLPELCNATVVGLVEVYDFMTSFVGHQLVKKVCTNVFIKNYTL